MLRCKRTVGGAARGAGILKSPPLSARYRYRDAQLPETATFVDSYARRPRYSGGQDEWRGAGYKTLVIELFDEILLRRLGAVRYAGPKVRRA